MPPLRKIYIDWLIDNYLTSNEQCFSYIQDEWVSDCCLNSKWAIFSYIMARTSYILIWWWWCPLKTFVLDQHDLLAYFNNSPRVDRHIAPLTWFLLLLFNTACLAEKPSKLCSNPLSTALGASTLTTTPLILCERQEELIDIGLVSVLLPSTRYQVFREGKLFLLY